MARDFLHARSNLPRCFVNALSQLIELLKACILFQIILDYHTFGIGNGGAPTFSYQLGENLQTGLGLPYRIHNLS